jgi:hypothetical protein
MNKGIWEHFRRHLFLELLLLVGLLWMVSCKDDYLYDDNEPEWLGSSIYDYLKSSENYTYYTRLIEEVEDYKEVLSKTGSKTLFVADDKAFEEFFKNNMWNVSSYDNLNLTQKKLILKFSMIDNAYLDRNLVELFQRFAAGRNGFAAFNVSIGARFSSFRIGRHAAQGRSLGWIPKQRYSPIKRCYFVANGPFSGGIA